MLSAQHGSLPCNLCFAAISTEDPSARKCMLRCLHSTALCFLVIHSSQHRYFCCVALCRQMCIVLSAHHITLHGAAQCTPPCFMLVRIRGYVRVCKYFGTYGRLTMCGSVSQRSCSHSTHATAARSHMRLRARPQACAQRVCMCVCAHLRVCAYVHADADVCVWCVSARAFQWTSTATSVRGQSSV